MTRLTAHVQLRTRHIDSTNPGRGNKFRSGHWYRKLRGRIGLLMTLTLSIFECREYCWPNLLDSFTRLTVDRRRLFHALRCIFGINWRYWGLMRNRYMAQKMWIRIWRVLRTRMVAEEWEKVDCCLNYYICTCQRKSRACAVSAAMVIMRFSGQF